MPLSSGPGFQIQKGGKQLFVFDLNVLDKSTRRVYGKASDPQLDRENETILKAAIEDALPNFMMLPIMHLDHTERPVGWFTKAEFQGQDLYVEANVKPTSDCDEFWDQVVKASNEGKPYQFSIYGDRKVASKSCSLPANDPRRVTNPCVTKSLELYSISICQPGTAINPNTFAEVRKAWDSATNIIHPVTDGKYPKEKKGSSMAFPPKKEDNPNPQDQPPAKDAPQKPDRNADNGPTPDESQGDPGQEQPGEVSSGGGLKEVIDLLTQMVQRQQKLEDLMSGYNMSKAEVKPEEEMTEKVPDKEETEKCTKKADVPVVEDTTAIIKANLDRISKAESRLDEVEKKIDLIMKSTAKKPDVLVVDEAAIKKAEETMKSRFNVDKLTRILG